MLNMWEKTAGMGTMRIYMGGVEVPTVAWEIFKSTSISYQYSNTALRRDESFLWEMSLSSCQISDAVWKGDASGM